jgi:hypothetical protein
MQMSEMIGSPIELSFFWTLSWFFFGFSPVFLRFLIHVLASGYTNAVDMPDDGLSLMR